MDDIPWFYVAMIFIAFVSWLRKQVTDAAAIRRGQVAERKAKEMARRTTRVDEQPNRYLARDSAKEEIRELPKQENIREIPETFRDVFKELERQVNIPESPAKTIQAPPPLPTQVQPQPESFAPAFGDIPEGALVRTSAAVVQKRKGRTRKAVSTSLAGMLREGQQLRTALILKEVLDPPKALRGKRV
tara:strand:- start:354 stop:917 length:564 start_codon:yes stop_codon:yes gene_type:complete